MRQKLYFRSVPVPWFQLYPPEDVVDAMDGSPAGKLKTHTLCLHYGYQISRLFVKENPWIGPGWLFPSVGRPLHPYEIQQPIICQFGNQCLYRAPVFV